MQLKPEIAIEERLNIQKVQKELYYPRYGSSPRGNNRKNTKSRKTQYISCIDDSVWPPKFSTKTIKHPSK